MPGIERALGSRVGGCDPCALELLTMKREEYLTPSGAAKPNPCIERLQFKRRGPRPHHAASEPWRSRQPTERPPKSGKPTVGSIRALHHEGLYFFGGKKRKRRKGTFVTATNCWRLLSGYVLPPPLRTTPRASSAVCVELGFDSCLTHPPFQSKNSPLISWVNAFCLMKQSISFLLFLNSSELKQQQ